MELAGLVNVRGQGYSTCVLRFKAGVLSFFALLLALAYTSAAQASPGDLDPTFGTAGVVRPPGGGADVAILPTGQIVTVGSEGECTEDNEEQNCQYDFVVELYNEDGTPDTSFGGGDGKVTTNFGFDVQGATSVAVQPDGKLVVAGTTYEEVGEYEEARQIAVARYNADGSIDTTFGGGDGEVLIPVSNPETLYMYSRSLVVQASGKIVVGADMRIVEELGPGFNEWVHHPVLVRLNADGSVDTSFGDEGVQIGPQMSLLGLAEEPGGKLLAAGRDFADFAVARFNSDGTLDTSFGEDGLFEHSSGEYLASSADDVIVQPDGKILASGYDAYGYMVVRLNPDGTPDTSFGGGDGIVLTTFQQPCCGLAAAISVALEPDGRIVFAGQWTPDEDTVEDEWGIGQLFPNGFADSSFGSGGLVTENFGGEGVGHDASRLAVQADGKVVVVGGIQEGSAMLRLLEGGSSTPPSTQNLLATTSGSGEGTVNGWGGATAEALRCPGNCAASYMKGETIEVSASPDEGSTFEGWSASGGNPGTCVGMASECELTLNDDVELVATFGSGGPADVSLEVEKAGLGAGSVTSSPVGIDCGSMCHADFVDGTTVTLTAAAQAGSLFTGWSGGGCSGGGTCSVTLDADTIVTANFSPKPGSGEEGGPGGGTPAGGSGSGGSTPMPPSAPSSPAPQPKGLKCKKGYRKIRKAGKTHCVKVKGKHHTHHE